MLKPFDHFLWPSSRSSLAGPHRSCPRHSKTGFRMNVHISGMPADNFLLLKTYLSNFLSSCCKLHLLRWFVCLFLSLHLWFSQVKSDKHPVPQICSIFLDIRHLFDSPLTTKKMETSGKTKYSYFKLLITT